LPCAHIHEVYIALHPLTARPAEGPHGQCPQHPIEAAPVRLFRGPLLDLVEGLADVDHSCTPVGNSSRATPSSPAGIRWLWFRRTSQNAAARRSGPSLRPS